MIQIAPLGSISSRDWILVCVAIILKQIDVVWLFFSHRKLLTYGEMAALLWTFVLSVFPGFWGNVGKLLPAQKQTSWF